MGEVFSVDLHGHGQSTGIVSVAAMIAPGDVRDGFEAQVAAPLGAAAAAQGYAVVGWRVDDALTLRLEKGGAGFELWLRPAAAATRAYRQTARFKLGYGGEPPDRAGLALVEVLQRLVEAWEPTLDDAAAAALLAAPPSAAAPAPGGDGRATLQPGLEWLAVRAGLKPACRHLLPADIAERLAAEARATDLQVRVTDAAAFAAGACGDGVAARATVLLHVARSAAAAGAAADAERAMIAATARGQRVADADVQALGAALGYPPCCVAAFLPRRDWSTAALRVAALRDTPGDADRLLNNVDEGRALISHCPCRYDCAASGRYARALWEAFAAGDAAAATALADALGGLFALFADGGALRLATARPAGAGPLRRAALLASGRGPRLAAWRAALDAADALSIESDRLCLWHGGAALQPLAAPPDAVQVRWFV